MSEQHRHDWVLNDGHDGIKAWICRECPETCATCGTCNGPSGTTLLLCRRCQDHADVTIDRIARALELWQPSLSRPDGTRFQRDDEDGGTDDNDVHGQLYGWVARWSEHAGASNEHWSDFLKGHHMWAAHNVAASDWPAYWKAIHHLMWRARGEAGLLPHVEPEPCVHCGGEVVRDWSDDNFEPLRGLSDTVRCTGCDMTWGSMKHWRESTWKWFERGAQEHQDAYVTLDMARTLWPDVPVSTMRSWAVRSEANYRQGVERAHEWWAAQPEIGPTSKPPDVMWALPARHRQVGTRHAADGTTLVRYDPEPRYRIGDLAMFVADRLDETRRGPKVASAAPDAVA